MNLKRNTFSIIVALLCFVIGTLTGIFVHCNNNVFNNIDASIKNGYSNTTENISPVEPYKAFLINTDNNVIDNLNSNPIDNLYYPKYTSCTSPKEEQEILKLWSQAYEKEFENAKSFFIKVIQENSQNENALVNKEEIQKLVIDFHKKSSEYCELKSELSYTVENFALGYGTNHVYNLLNNTLQENRNNTLSLIECIIIINGEYTWSQVDVEVDEHNVNN